VKKAQEIEKPVREEPDGLFIVRGHPSGFL
jgi:hypothetical protein